MSLVRLAAMMPGEPGRGDGVALLELAGRGSRRIVSGRATQPGRGPGGRAA